MASFVRERQTPPHVALDEPRAVVRSLPLKDRLIIQSGLGIITLLAWVYLLDMARGMNGMATSMRMAWTTGYFVAMLLMWIVMMIGMMVPSAIPMALIHAAVARKAARAGTTLPSTGFFVAGYVLIWSAFSVGATAAQWGLDRASLLSPMMVSNSPILGGILLFAAGLYQFTPTKEACLRQCRSPVHFMANNWRPGAIGALRMGFAHGAYCLGCCWILMCLLFFGGVMSIGWIGGLALFVLLEKILPGGRLGGQILGLAATVWGIVLILSGLLR
jgi:predicted metal-binding membrane protein